MLIEQLKLVALVHAPWLRELTANDPNQRAIAESFIAEFAALIADLRASNVDPLPEVVTATILKFRPHDENGAAS